MQANKTQRKLIDQLSSRRLAVVRVKSGTGPKGGLISKGRRDHTELKKLEARGLIEITGSHSDRAEVGVGCLIERSIWYRSPIK